MLILPPHSPEIPNPGNPDSQNQVEKRRRAFTLILVISLLALFAIVGVGFVYYSQSQATNSKLAREAEVLPRPEVDPELMFCFAMSQLIYGANDDELGVQSALRGHSLARLMYGYNPNGSNTIPFNGQGRLKGITNPTLNHEEFELINFTWFENDGFLRDPGYSGSRMDPSQPLSSKVTSLNVPYTYPDLNNMFLAAVNKEGQILMPSFHRPWLFGSLDPSNPNWKNDKGKYFLLRPRPEDHARDANGDTLFPYPEDEGGDVKNWFFGPGIPKIDNNGQVVGYYNNDSVWLDVGFPVMTGPNGVKFKPLVAFLIIDLDNKLNLNMHGNLTSPDKTSVGSAANRYHSSNQGWGPWEVSLAKVLNADAQPMQQGEEWKNLFVGDSSLGLTGRYGNDKVPGGSTSSNPFNGTTWPHFYAQVDWDGMDTSNPTNPAFMELPGTSSNSLGIIPFPFFPQSRFKNGDSNESKWHPSTFNYFSPANDRLFPITEMESILRFQDTGSPFLRSELNQLCPTNFADPKIRRLVTTLSMDVNRPGVSPWLTNKSTNPSVKYAWNMEAANAPPYPQASPVAVSSSPPSGVGEFGWDGRSLAAALQKLDLNRPLTPYPTPNASDQFDPDEFEKVTKERSAFAREIFDLLRWVTTGNAPHVPIPEYDITQGADNSEYFALRFLAQLSVNIVDYIDEDEIMTAMRWNTTVDQPPETRDKGTVIITPGYTLSGVAFGTEMPRVVINEVYTEAANHPNDLTGGAGPITQYQVNFWVELLNPLQDDPLLGTSDVKLRSQSVDVFRLKILNSGQAGLGGPQDTLGKPDDSKVKGTVSDFGNGGTPKTIEVIQDGMDHYKGPDGGNKGFYVVGPSNVDLPGVTSTHKSGQMSYTVSAGPTTHNTLINEEHSVLLQRLACPFMPHNDMETSPFYNPYITIDYVENIQTNDGITLKPPRQAHVPTDIDKRFSMGRKQPYAAAELVAQDPINPPAHKHTFFSHNGRDKDNLEPTLTQPFDWLVHLDRPLRSPMELLHVSGYRPFELTQRFMLPNGTQFAHRAPWLDQQARIYRFLEFVQTRPRSAGVDPHGRIPGKININTIWDEEAFQALCDAPTTTTSSPFTEAGVKVIFTNLLDKRTEKFPILSKTDSPFKSLATGYDGNGGGLADTILASVGQNQLPDENRLLGVPGASHPYEEMEALTKIYNNATVRSNVFAVFMTVGFFEVKDETTRPVKLGAEIGKAEGRHKRYRWFAIVDRTQLGVFPQEVATLTEDVSLPNGKPGLATLKLDKVGGPVPFPPFSTIPVAKNWSLAEGMQLEVSYIEGSNTFKELVTVQSVGSNTIQVQMTKDHKAGDKVYLVGVYHGNIAGGPGHSVYGNPGPQLQFDPRKYPAVVPFFTQIE